MQAVYGSYLLRSQGAPTEWWNAERMTQNGQKLDEIRPIWRGDLDTSGSYLVEVLTILGHSFGILPPGVGSLCSSEKKFSLFSHSFTRKSVVWLTVVSLIPNSPQLTKESWWKMTEMQWRFVKCTCDFCVYEVWFSNLTFSIPLRQYSSEEEVKEETIESTYAHYQTKKKKVNL